MVFLLSFLGFGFTFHRFLGNQTNIENSRERERDLLGGDVDGARLEEEVEVGRVGLENPQSSLYTACTASTSTATSFSSTMQLAMAL